MSIDKALSGAITELKDACKKLRDELKETKSRHRVELRAEREVISVIESERDQLRAELERFKGHASAMAQIAGRYRRDFEKERERVKELLEKMQLDDEDKDTYNEAFILGWECCQELAKHTLSAGEGGYDGSKDYTGRTGYDGSKGANK